MDAIVIVSTIGVLLAGYVVGSFPTAYLLTRRLKGVDIRTVGTRNPGAINVFHIVGPWGGITVLAVDALKGAAVLLTIQAMDGHDAAIFAGALGTVVGHNWPIFLRFRGGKGVATSAGTSLVCFPAYAPADVALATGLSFLSRGRAELSAGVTSAVFVIAATYWWTARRKNAWGPEPTVGLPLYALASSALIIQRLLSAPPPIEGDDGANDAAEAARQAAEALA